ncbi:hypothetical protein PUMCH_004777 [Australozyma saopauloensis]|uniref:Sporulation-specific protein 73 n=1 Tax=Australozyma saopauloensis TaxID=291208 RepID=A0AAX4HHL7_9ASCO|nr:hypothetical protein PUMCH_004777 [[Candida] saopauloensis]
MQTALNSYNSLLEQLEKSHFDTFGYSPNNSSLVSLLVSPNAKSQAPLAEEYKIDALIENQRGLKFFGVPLFSGKSLLPVLDPPMFQRLNGKRVKLSYDSLDNYVLPDFGWSWSWSSWYVLMLHDVDELGWAYLGVWGKWWHGKYRFGDCVRRRVWVRMRQRASS